MYRNKKITQGANGAPCQNEECGKKDGTTVAAHSNQYRDGKGIGIKSHDYRVAYLCHECHNFVDFGIAPKAQRTALWESAHRNTIGYIFENGIVK